MNKKTLFFMTTSIITMMLFSIGCSLDGTDPADNGSTGGGSNAVYAIGDPGPADGIIFYIDTADEHSWTYLEVAPASTEWTDKEWGDYGTEIGGDAQLTGVGDGQAATDAIVKHLADNTSETDRAAQLCDALEHEYDGTTYDDWFLPSEDELNAIWDNLVDDGSGANSGVGGFAGVAYWSSSEVNGDLAWYQSFNNGNQDVISKGLFGRAVRAVRAF